MIRILKIVMMTIDEGGWRAIRRSGVNRRISRSGQPRRLVWPMVTMYHTCDDDGDDDGHVINVDEDIGGDQKGPGQPRKAPILK